MSESASTFGLQTGYLSGFKLLRMAPVYMRPFPPYALHSNTLLHVCVVVLKLPERRLVQVGLHTYFLYLVVTRQVE